MSVPSSVQPPNDLKVSPEDRLARSQPPRPAPKAPKPPKPPRAPKPPKPPRAPKPPKPPKPPRQRKTAGAGAGGPRRRLLGALFSWSITAAIWLVIAGGAVVAYYGYDLPDLDSLTATLRKPSVTLLAADGETIAAYGDVYGAPVTLAEVPASLPQAVIATEDRHFYHHFGLDVLGLVRAVAVNLRAGHVVQGGSTITQQLAKNLFLTPERNLRRKVQELLMALWLERKFTKEQILTLYLNRVYLGSGSWGVDAAARRYFDRPAKDLNLYQSALLAGLLKAPSRYNPQNDPELSQRRTTQVLANMVAAGMLTQGDVDRALREGPATVRQVFHTGRYFADWVHDQVERYTAEGRDIVVRTTLDLALQRKVEAELEATLAGPGAKAGAGQAAMVVMTPDGAIRAMAGGRNYAASQFNRAVQGARQPGSSFKAFLYLAALEAGWSEGDSIEDAPISAGRYRPENYTGKYEGAVTLRHAFAKSSNVAAVRLIEKIGPKRVAAVAHRLGITSELRPDASLALGTSEASLVEMTAAYATFANDGNGVFPHGVTEIRDAQGETLQQRQGGGTGRVVAPHLLHQMKDMMSAVVEEGTGKSAAIDRPAAGKTGTTQDYRDAWFIGYTADYVGGVWFGNDDGTPMHKVTGGGLPTKLWHDVMMAAHKGLPARPLPDGEEGAPSAAEHQPAPSDGAGETLDSIWNGLVKMLGG